MRRRLKPAQHLMMCWDAGLKARTTQRRREGNIAG